MKKINIKILNEASIPNSELTDEWQIARKYILSLHEADRASDAGMSPPSKETNFRAAPMFSARQLNDAISKILQQINPGGERIPTRPGDVSHPMNKACSKVIEISGFGLLGRGMARVDYSKPPSSMYFMAKYDSGELNNKELDPMVMPFIKKWRTILDLSFYIRKVRESGPRAVAPRDRYGRKLSRQQFDRQMKNQLRKMSKRDRMDPVERALYDMNPDNKPGVVKDIVLSMLDPRGPWGYAGKNAKGESENNWQAFKGSLEDLNKASGAGETALALVFVGLNGLGLIPMLPSGKGGAAARGARKAGQHTAADLNREAAKLAQRAKSAAVDKGANIPAAQRTKIKQQADELLAITKHNDEVLKKYPKGVCVKKKVVNESKNNLLTENIVCIAPPFLTNSRGRIIDPETNPQAYGLSSADDIFYGGDGSLYAQSRDFSAANIKSKKTSTAAPPPIPIAALKATAKSGRASGVIVTSQGHTFVRVMVGNKPVVFMKGSGTSQARIVRDAQGRMTQIVPMETLWYPIGDLSRDPRNMFGDGSINLYPKIGMDDAKFRYEVDNQVVPNPNMQNGQIAQFDGAWDRQMSAKHGRDWPRKLDKDRAVRDDAMKGWDNGKFQVFDRVDKWPHPKSEYGKIAAQIAKADDAGELEKVFGKVRNIDPNNSRGSRTFHKWQNGDLDSVEAGFYNRKRDEGKFSKKLLKIINEEIVSVLGSYQKS